MVRLVILLFWAMANQQVVFGHLQVPGLDKREYVKLGDLNIGFLVNFHRYSLDGFCSDEFTNSAVLDSESISYIIELINNRSDILPNITLGFLVQDACRKDVTALARAVEFAAESVMATRKNDSSASSSCSDPETDARRIVGVVGPIFSGQAVMVSSFLGLFRIPVLSPMATSDELSDKSRFEYFTRLVAPDAFQARAIVDILLYFEWTYVSLLYSEGSYGENAAKQIEKLTHNVGTCIAFSHRISSEADDEEFKHIVDELGKNHLARAVVLFVSRHHALSLFSSLTKYEISGWFKFVAGDTMLGAWSTAEVQEIMDCFIIGHPGEVLPGFTDYFTKLSCKDSPNQWMGQYCEEIFKCTWSDNTNQTSCETFSPMGQTVLNLDNVNRYSDWADGALVYAHALHDLISDNCPQAFTYDKSVLDECISGDLLLRFMKNGTVLGYNGEIKFDEKGDMKARYVINQVQISGGERILQPVGKWEAELGALYMNKSKLRWTNQEDTSVTNGSEYYDPESVCAKSCLEKEYYHRLELPCCWECRSCRENERIVRNYTSCKICDLFTWPDNETGTECLDLDPEYFHYTTPTGIALLCLAGLGIMVWFAVTTIMACNFKKTLIKASSRELSVLMLCGICLAFILVFIFATKPSEVMCQFRTIGFHLAVTLIYGSLLIKSLRIYRIFATGLKGNTRPKLVNSKVQILFVGIIMTVQVVTLVYIHLNHPSMPKLLMPVRTVPYVELTCAQPLWAFLVPLCYNTSIIVVCGIFGFLTRNLPENFNDSWYIFISMATTLFMWIVFIPTYFTMFYAVHKSAVSAVCPLLNALITLVFQFCPRMYAVYYVKEDKIKFSSITTMSAS